MTNSTLSPREALNELDSRHDELIRRLDELNARIERALAEIFADRDAATANGERRKAA